MITMILLMLLQTAMLVLAVTLHNIPEGMAVGVVFAGWLTGNTAITLAAFAEELGLWSADRKFTLNLTLFNRLPMHRQVNELVGEVFDVTGFADILTIE